MTITPQSRDQMIRTIIGEAGNQGVDGWRAVAHVIKNRVDSGAWGPRDGGIGRVIYAPKQFSTYNPGNASGELARHADPNSPAYQRIGQIVDNVFDTGDADNTGGATHFFNPKLASPSWAAQGTNVRQIGDHTFMTVPLSPDSTAGTALASYKPPVVTNEPGGDAGSARTFLSALSGHPGRPGDTSNLHPDFAVKLAAALKDASNQGLHLNMYSGFRTPDTAGSAYDAEGKSSHTYGIAADIGGLDGPNGPKTQRWAQIAAAHGLSNPYGVGNAKEFNHWQLLPYPLETHPEQLAALKADYAHGDQNAVWAAAAPVPGGDPRPEDAAANRMNGMVAPAQPFQPAQPLPVKPGQAPTTTAPAPALGTPDPNAKFQLNTGTTTQGGPRPQMFTSLNLGGGGQTGSPPPAAAPASAPAPAPAPAPEPVRDDRATAPPSIMSNWGATTPIDTNTIPEIAAQNRMPGSAVLGIPPMTEGAPSMGFPAMTNPFGAPPTPPVNPFRAQTPSPPPPTNLASLSPGGFDFGGFLNRLFGTG